MSLGDERPRVLVVDDERGLRELLEYGLEQAGFSVRSVTEGSAALPLLETWSPDVIVLDVMLPGSDGLALLPEIRRLTTAPVIMLTARTEITEKVAGLSAAPMTTSENHSTSKSSSLAFAHSFAVQGSRVVKRLRTPTSVSTRQVARSFEETAGSNYPPASSISCWFWPSTRRRC